jgi:hypothetical protein
MASPFEQTQRAGSINPAGIAMDATCHPIALADLEAVTALARHLAPDLVIVGPEQPLVEGLADQDHPKTYQEIFDDVSRSQVVVVGTVLGISRKDVTPPLAAARVACAKSSLYVSPGSRK